MAGIGKFLIGISSIGDGLEDYLAKITSEHNKAPNYMALMEQLLEPLVRLKTNIYNMVNDFDLDQAVGAQLDILGLWIGVSRLLSVPLTGVYFTFNTGPGYNNGILKGPFDPSTQLVSLPDPQYRLLLKATAAANQWDGTIEGAYAAYAILLEGTGFDVFIYDFQDMSMSIALVGGVPTPIIVAMFTGGLLNLKPDGVRIRDYIYPIVSGPVFAFNLPASTKTAGFNQGAFAKFISGS